jgi:accessory gene regulator protein AgrB
MPKKSFAIIIALILVIINAVIMAKRDCLVLPSIVNTTLLFSRCYLNPLERIFRGVKKIELF